MFYILINGFMACEKQTAKDALREAAQLESSQPLSQVMIESPKGSILTVGELIDLVDIGFEW